MSPDHEALLRRNAQCAAEWHAWRGPFIVRAALMFNVPTSEVTNAQYAAAVERTQWDTRPLNVLVSEPPQAVRST